MTLKAIRESLRPGEVVTVTNLAALQRWAATL